MSLEQALADNTAAVKELSTLMAAVMAAPKSVQALAPAASQAIAKAAAAPNKTAAAKTPTAASAGASAPASTAATEGNDAAAATAPGTTDAPAASSDAQPIPYEKVSSAVTTFAAANGRETTLAILAKYGATSGKTIKPADYAAVLEELTSVA